MRSRRLAVLLLAVVTTGATLGGIERGNRHYRAGQYAEAVEAYRAALGTRHDSPVLRYNLGTALLRLGRYEEAEEHLRAALDAVEPDAIARVQYNLGLRFLEEARASADARQARDLYDAALDAYRHALRLEPGDRDAKWNYELALRERDRTDAMAGPDGAEGDEGAGDPDGEPGEAGGRPGGEGRPDDAMPRPPRPDGDTGPMSEADADRILNAIEQDERDLIQSRLRQGRPPTRVERDW